MKIERRIARIVAKCDKDENGCLNYPTLRKSNRPVMKFNGSVMSASRAMWLLLNGPTDLYVLHKCDNPSCLNVNHLFLGTQADNMRDKADKGRALQGERCPTSKLTEKTVLGIKRLRAKGHTYKQIADESGASFSNVALIIQGRSWRHVVLPDKFLRQEKA